MATDEEVEKQRTVLVELRQQVADAQAAGGDKSQELANDITLMNMQAEEARLRAELALAKENQKVTVLREGALAPLSTAKEQMRAAVAAQEATEKEIAASRKTKATPTPTDAEETNGTTEEQSSNKGAQKNTQQSEENK